MLNRICVLFLALVTALPVLADEDDWDNVGETAAPAAETPAVEAPAQEAPVQAEPAAESAPAAEPAAVAAPGPEASAKPAEKKEDPFAKLEAAKTPADTTPKATVGREVPVRYWVMGDSVEQEAIFVKIERDTVYLKRPNADEQKNLEKLQEQTIAAMEESNGQHQEEEEDDEADSVATSTPPAPVAVADTTPAEPEQPQEQVQEADDGADDDFETALQKEDTRMKLEEIARVEEEIRQQEIQDSIAADSANPFIKIFRLDLRRLYNMEDDEMIDLGLSNYVVPEYVDDEEEWNFIRREARTSL